MAARNSDKQVTGWLGWIYFAGFMILLAGIIQSIAGLTALLSDSFYIIGRENLLVFDYTTWGWVHILLGIILICTGTALFSGSRWARVVATMLAVFNFVVQFAFLPSYPLWSITAMILDVLIIYALTVHGEEAAIDA